MPNDLDTFITRKKTGFELREEIAQENLVSNPKHYKQGAIECIDAMEAMLSEEEFIGYLRGNSFKYRWRYKHKDMPIHDLYKAKWYEERLIKFYKKLEVLESDGSKGGTDC